MRKVRGTSPAGDKNEEEKNSSYLLQKNVLPAKTTVPLRYARYADRVLYVEK